MNQPTKTTNRLHFSDLDPLRFEDLCLDLVYHLNNWKKINHFGRKGKDGGIDIFAIKEENGVDKNWAIQCKRYLAIRKSDIKEIIDKIVKKTLLPDKLLVIVSCDVGEAIDHFFNEYANENGIKETEMWTASVLEAKLYKENKNLLFKYFNLHIENDTEDNITKINHSLKMEKRILNELIDHKFTENTKHSKQLLFEPYLKFISTKVIIRPIKNDFYPNFNDETLANDIHQWFKPLFYDTYHNGIEVCLDCGFKVLIDKDENWELSDTLIKGNSEYEVFTAKQIGRIPYSNIVNFKADGDEYYSEPQLFCKYDSINGPFDEIYFKVYNDPKLEIRDWTLDNKKKTKFLKE